MPMKDTKTGRKCVEFVLKVCVILFVVNAGWGTLHAQDLEGYDVAIAEDIAEWPPYTYFERKGTAVTENVVGFSVDIVDAIFSDNNMTYHIELMPFPRAMENVHLGHKHVMILNASCNPERCKKYYMSAPYYQTKGCYFYSKNNHPDGLDITCKADLHAYHVGGIHGFNYTHYGLDNENVDRGTYKFGDLMQKMKFGRVDLFLENYETIVGYTRIGYNFLTDEDIGYGHIEDVPPVEFRMWFTKNETGLALRNIIDQGLVKLHETGEYDKIYRKYFPEQ